MGLIYERTNEDSIRKSTKSLKKGDDQRSSQFINPQQTINQQDEEGKKSN